MAFCNSALVACRVSGKASTGVLVFANQTPVDWHAKSQKSTKTAVYGAEFSAARTGTELVMDVQVTVRALGATIRWRSLVAWRQPVSCHLIHHSTLCPWQATQFSIMSQCQGSCGTQSNEVLSCQNSSKHCRHPNQVSRIPAIPTFHWSHTF